MTIARQLYGVSHRTDVDSGGQAIRWWSPPLDALGASSPVVLWSHPQGQNEQLSPSYFGYPFIHACIQEGWRVAATNQHGVNSSGAAPAVADLTNLHAYMNARHPVSKVILLGGSMGGLATANAVSHTSVPNVVGAAVLDGVFDLAAFYADPTYKGTVVTGFGLAEGTLSGATTIGATSLPTTASYPTTGTQLLVGAGTANVETVTTTGASTGTAVPVTATTKTHASADAVSDYPTKTAGYNPMLTAASAFTGIRWRFWASSADTTVPIGTHSTPFAARISAAPEAAVQSHTGGHLANTGVWPDDLVAFIKRCLG